MNIQTPKFRFYHTDRKTMYDVKVLYYTDYDVPDKVTCKYMDGNGIIKEEEFDSLFGELIPSILYKDKKGNDLYCGDMVDCQFLKDNYPRFIFYDNGYRILGLSSAEFLDNLDMVERTGNMFTNEKEYETYKDKFNIK